jgi:predicted ATPase
LGHTPEGKRLVSTLRRHAPMWLAQLPSLLDPAERKRLQRDVRGSSRERMLREMAEAIEALTEEITLILVLEDLHWSDYATLDLASFLAHRSEPARLLILGVYRPEELTQPEHPLKHIRHNLQTRHQCQEIAIPPLSLEAINEYLQGRFPGHAFPSVLASLLSKRTGGNPLFLVTVIEHLVARGLITPHESGWRLNGALEDMQTEMPGSIQQIIAAQIDRLTPEEQNVLEVASVAGMDFSAAAVAAGLAADVVAVETCCEELARREQFLRAQGAEEWPDGTVATRYEFMHSLYQQAWYERVTAARRVQLHCRIGERGEHAYGDRVRKIAAELAVHFERGRNIQRAVLYRYYAADNAMSRFGHQEAISHLTTGLALLSTQPATPERDQQEIALQSALGAARLATQGYAEPAVEQAYARAHTLCQQVATPPDLASALHGLWAYYLARAEFSIAQTFATRLLQIAQQEQSHALLLEAERILGQTLYFLGNLPEARRHLESSFKRYNSQEHAAQIFLYSQDPGVVSLAQNARALSLMGYPDQAIQQAEEAIALAKEVAHPYSLALAKYQAAVVYHTQRDLQRMQAILKATVALSPEHGIPYWLSSMQVLKGWVLASQGKRKAGLEVMRQGLIVSQEIGTALNRPYSLVLLAEMYGASGEAAEGLVLLHEAEQSVKKTGGHFNQAEIYRLTGELALQQCKAQSAKCKVQNDQHPTPNTRTEAEAEAYFHKAIEIAQRQEAKLLELRASVSLSRLWRRQGKVAQARQLLTTLYGWFTEGFAAVDLQEAKTLLEELS